MSHARYLGDGVYAQFDGYSVVITTGSHLAHGGHDQCIIMEPEVVECFQRYVSDLKARLEAEPTGKPEQI
jgi:hypothetical protein